MDLVSPHPFWPLKDGLPATYPSLDADQTCDVAILGAGITGALVAERLSRSGLKVVVLDKRDAASGSTSASTALLQYELDTSLVELTKMYGQADAARAWQLCSEHIDQIETLIRDLKIDCGFQRKKSVYLASSRSDARTFQKEFEARREAGLDVELWSAADVEGRFPFRREAALFSSQAAELDPYRLTHGLLGHVIKNGGRVFDRTLVTKIDSSSSEVTLSTDRGFTVKARHVVFATGYESQQYLPSKVVTLKSSYALATEPLKEFTGWWERTLIWESARPYLYLRTTEDGRAFVGGEDDDFRNPVRRDARVERKTERLAKSFRKLFPKIAMEVAYRWAGTFGETKDGLAYIGSLPQMPFCTFALGFGGNGVVYSAVAASLIDDAVHGRRNADMRLFRFDR